MNLALDKQLHLAGGIIIALALGVFSIWIGLIAAVAIGAAKEIVYDKMLGRGTPDIYDFLATAVGGGIGVLYLFCAGAIR